MDKREALANLLNTWKDGSNRTNHFIAEKTGIGYSTVRKIVAQSTEANGDIALRLLAFIYPHDPQLIHLFAQKYYPELVSITKLLVDLKTESVDLPVLNSSALLAVVRISCSQQGMPKSEIMPLFGRAGESILSKLLELEVLTQKDNNLYAASGMMYIIKQSSLKQISNLAVDLVDSSEPASAHFVAFEGLNPDTVEEIRRKLEETQNFIYEKLTDAKNHGDLKIVTSLIMTTI